ncbi:hypothetical protein BBP40_002166 [Aspergillus hancockii]|nr:hypothetical protein BBP40_002166 [Aspergillus hancockii]
MAQLAENSWYQWYVREVEAGRLKLPEYNETAAGEVIINYGEVFCRSPDCGKRRKRFSSTNNLKSHVRSHKSLEVDKEDKGGRVSQEEVDKASV